MEPGDLLEVGARLRRLLAVNDDLTAIIGASFLDLDPQLEAVAVVLRPRVDEVGQLVYRFLDKLEKRPDFMAARTRVLERRER